jgi:transposase-like protein
VTIRRVIEVLQKLLGPEIALSSAQVGRAAAKLYKGSAEWRNRYLGETPCLLLDAIDLESRLEGRIVDCAALIAIGIEACGKGRLLGCDIAITEAEINWRHFLEGLLIRALNGMRLIVVDDRVRLNAARRVRLSTTEGLQRIDRELRCRTCIAGICPNPYACLRLVSALLAELDEEWMTSKVHLHFNL